MESEKEAPAHQSSEYSVDDINPNVVLVDYDDDDPANPLNWSTVRKWLMTFAISWMGFVAYVSIHLPPVRLYWYMLIG